MDEVAGALAAALVREHPQEAAQLMESRSAETCASLLAAHSPASVARVMAHWNARLSVQVLLASGPGRAAEILEALPLEQSVPLLRTFPEERQKEIFAEAGRSFAGKAATLLKFPETAVGACMDPFALTLRESLTAEEATGLLHLFADDLRDYLYILDDDRRLTGVISVRRLLPLSPHTALREAMTSPVISISPHSSITDLAGHPGWRQFRLLPVATADSRFLGVLKYEAVAKQGGAREGEETDLGSTGKALGELYGVGVRAVFRSGLAWAWSREEK